MIQDSAMIVKLKISQWGARVKDKEATDYTTVGFKATESAGTFTKALIDKTGLEQIRTAVKNIRDFHYKNTMPWGDRGERLLTSKSFIDYKLKMSGFEQDFESAIIDFVARYSDLIDQAEQTLGEMFNRNEYPDISQIREKFAYELKIEPVPDSNDFRVTLQESEVEQIKNSIEKKNQEYLENAVQDLWQRLQEKVAVMHKDLTEEKEIYRFKNSLVDNLVELCTLIPNMNLTGDKELDRMCKDVLDNLCSYDAGVLRKDEKIRQEIGEKAGMILDQLNQKLGIVTVLSVAPSAVFNAADLFIKAA